MKTLLQFLLVGYCLSLTNFGYAAQHEFSGNALLEYRYFPHEPVDPRQHGNNTSLSIEPEYAIDWDDGRQSFVTRIFARWDEGDDERTHADIREMLWTKAQGDWEIRAGVGKEFWGVTESRHLVDIINQTDLVENLDQEDKLGQPMVNVNWIQDWGTLQFFVLPYFRERTFAGVEGRPRFHPYVDTDQAVFQSPDEQNHIDYAFRYAHTWAEWDFGISYFDGTGRIPRFVLGLNSQGEPVLIPHYDLIQQVGLDIQGTFDAWLWKLEAINYDSDFDDHVAFTGGLEYTFFGVFESNADVGIVVEYLYDDRGSEAQTPFQDDVLFAARLTLNDEQSTELLIGPIVDRHTNSVFYNLEASRRLGQSWKLELEARFYEKAPPQDPAYGFRNDDYFQVILGYYY